MDAKLIFDAKAELGEGAIWEPRAQVLYWVDIERKTFNIFDPVNVSNKSFNTGERVGTVVPVDNTQVMLALQTGIVFMDIVTGNITPKKRTDIHLQHNKRFNDGKCDAAGRFWVGSLSVDGVHGVSSLYCLSADFDMLEKQDGISISNGIAWSLSGDMLYHIDTPQRKVYGYDFNPDTGDITNRRIVINTPEAIGFPDGMTIDSEGMLWIAFWDGFCVARFNPVTGALLQVVNVPVPKVTSCAFGGAKLDQLFITTASVEMSTDELDKYPLSGGLFIAEAGVSGIPAFSFKP